MSNNITTNVVALFVLIVAVVALAGLPVVALFAFKRVFFTENKNDAYECGF